MSAAPKTPYHWAADPEFLINLARRCGLRESMHGYNATQARTILREFVTLLDAERRNNDWRDAVLDALAAWPGMDFPVTTPPADILAAVLKIEREAAVTLAKPIALPDDAEIRSLIERVLDAEFVALVPGQIVELQTTAPVTYNGLRAIFELGVSSGVGSATVDQPMTEPFVVTGTDAAPKSFAALYSKLEGTPSYEAARAEVAAEIDAAAVRTVHLTASRASRIYIAGPMSGLPNFNFPAFNAKAAELRDAGWHVENPAEHGHVRGAQWADYLRYDIGRLATCEAIYLLPGWSKSKGATLEVTIARKLGMPILGDAGAELDGNEVVLWQAQHERANDDHWLNVPKRLVEDFRREPGMKVRGLSVAVPPSVLTPMKAAA